MCRKLDCYDYNVGSVTQLCLISWYRVDSARFCRVRSRCVVAPTAEESVTQQVPTVLNNFTYSLTWCDVSEWAIAETDAVADVSLQI